MKILTIHADYIDIEPTKKAIKGADEVKEKRLRSEECLVVFSAVEKRDENNLDGIVEKYVGEIKDIAKQVKAKNLVLYPYAHLSSDLSSPKAAQEVLEKAYGILKKEFTVIKAPFGWYKAFDIRCKGHPLAELSREFSCEGESKGKKKEKEESKALKAEKTMKSYFYILDPKGKLSPIKYDKGKRKFSGFEFQKYEKLRKLSAYEMAKDRAVDEEPPHVRLMKKLELVDYEPGSDPGNLRYYPKGRMIKGLIERYVNQTIKENGGMEIETPLMYDFEHPSLKSYLNRFPARQYAIETPNKKVFLRFAACFGGNLMAHDANISYKQLPVWLYELTRYSFRVEQRGELTGLRRLRAFTMPDCHALCADEEQAKTDLVKRFEMSRKMQDDMGVDSEQDLELALRMTKKFYESHKEFVHGLVKRWGRAALVEMWDEQFFYFVFKYEFNFVDNLGKASALTTDQIDVENAKRYGITYIDNEGKEKYPLILHLSPSGAVERIIYALLEKAAADQKKGKPPILPLWLSPTQVRLIPVSTDKHLKYCEELSKKFEKEKIRVDMDDRVEGVGKRIRSSELDWVPFTLVIGDKEIENKKEVNVRDKENNKEEKMKLEELIKLIKEKVKGRPYEPIPVPKYLSKRIIFVG